MDERSCLTVYEAETGAPLWSAEGVASAAWNARLDAMLAWSDGDQLYTRTGNLPVQCHAVPVQASLHFPCCILG